MAKKKILVVDDSAAVRREAAAALVQAGFDAIEAVDGEDGASAVASHDDIAAIVCDVNMPRLNGIDMLIRIRSWKKAADIPVLMLTTEGEPSLIRKAKDAGAKAWVLKPFNATQLIAVVRKLTA